MLTKRVQKTITWVDLESPSKEEVRQIMREYDLHPLVANELLAPSLRDRVDTFPGYLYVILHFPSMVHSHSDGRDQEVDFIIGKDFLITAHYYQIDSINEFAKLFEIDGMVGHAGSERHGGIVFFYLLRKFYETMEREIDTIELELDEVEKNIYLGRESLMVRNISSVGHKLLNFRHISRPHRNVFESLEFEVAAKSFFGKESTHYVRSIGGQYHKVQATLDSAQELLDSLRLTNDSLLTTKTNDIVRTLTIMSFITFPLTLLAAIFGMDVEEMPIVGSPNDFWIIIGMMAAGVAAMFVFFKRKRWL